MTAKLGPVSVVFAASVLAATAPAQDVGADGTPSLATTRQQASYAIGLNIGRDLQTNGVQVSAAALIQGIQDVLNRTEPRLSEEKCEAALHEFQQEMQAKNEERRRALGAKNKAEGEAFLTANKEKAGVASLPSGLQYRVLKSGSGPMPKLTDTVKTHYHGTLIDGTVFDSSLERNEPVVFPVGGVIRGWTEALQRMRVGDRWRLFVPSELAYGARGRGQVIGPNSVLVFDVELLSIE